MTLYLHLGVLDLPYADNTSYRKAGVRKPKSGAGGSKTTYDIAQILEAEYGVFEKFVEAHKPEMVDALIDSFEGAAEAMMMGAPITLDPAGEGTSKIDQMFKDFLSNKELDKIGVVGVPTLAAQRGVSHRFAHPYAKRPPRPSFIDTGLYQGAFRSWTENE